MTPEHKAHIENLTAEYLSAVSEYADTIVVSVAFDTIASGDTMGLVIQGYGSPMGMLGLLGMSELHLKKKILNMEKDGV